MKYYHRRIAVHIAVDRIVTDTVNITVDNQTIGAVGGAPRPKRDSVKVRQKKPEQSPALNFNDRSRRKLHSHNKRLCPNFDASLDLDQNGRLLEDREVPLSGTTGNSKGL